MSKVQVHKMAEGSISTLALSQEIAEMFEGVSKRPSNCFKIGARPWGAILTTGFVQSATWCGRRRST